MFSLRDLHYGYLLFASGFVVGSIVFRYIELHAGIGGLALVSIALFLLYILIIAVYGLLFIWSLLQSRWKVALSLFGGMGILCTIFVFGQILNDSIFYVIDLSRFQLNREHYNTVVRETPSDSDGIRVIFFDWGAGGYQRTNFFYVLVYDNSGQIALPDTNRTKKWKQIVSAQYNFLNEDGCSSKVKNLNDAFYVVQTLCQ